MLRCARVVVRYGLEGTLYILQEFALLSEDQVATRDGQSFVDSGSARLGGCSLQVTIKSQEPRFKYKPESAKALET